MSETLSTTTGDAADSHASRGAVSHAAEVVAAARRAFDDGVTKPREWRVAQLRALRSLLVDHEDELAEALHADLGKSATEAWVTETGFVVREIDHTLRHLRSWTAPRRVPVPLSLAPGRAKVVREPLGVVLVIAPWNYPVQLCLAPLVGALAAGNAVVLKPSEIAPATSRALARLLPLKLDAAAVHVVEGAVPETTALLAERFDHIFYTGNGVVGRIVLEAATRHLTPVTLELGGKSPAYVADDADLRVTAQRLVWGKFTNAGQTCVAPDYVIASRPTLEALKPLLVEAIRAAFGPDPSTSPDYGRIIGSRHFDRLTALIDPARVVSGGRSDASTRYLEPTVVDVEDADDPQELVMRDEIFGPLLPLVAVDGLDAAVDFVNRRDKPLALYVFAEDDAVQTEVLDRTTSGGVCVNATLFHITVPSLPFGGVGESGMGAYHGRATFDTFTHRKSVFTRPTRLDPSIAYPPYTPLKAKLLRKFL